MNSCNEKFSEDHDLAVFEVWLQNELIRTANEDEKFTKSVFLKISEFESGKNDSTTQWVIFSLGLAAFSISVLLINNLSFADDSLALGSFAKYLLMTCLLLISCWSLQSELDSA